MIDPRMQEMEELRQKFQESKLKNTSLIDEILLNLNLIPSDHVSSDILMNLSMQLEQFRKMYETTDDEISAGIDFVKEMSKKLDLLIRRRTLSIDPLMNEVLDDDIKSISEDLEQLTVTYVNRLSKHVDELDVCFSDLHEFIKPMYIQGGNENDKHRQ